VVLKRVEGFFMWGALYIMCTAPKTGGLFCVGGSLKCVWCSEEPFTHL